MDGGAWKAAEGQTRLSDFTFTFHFHALEKEMATHFSVLAWRIPGTVEPGGLPSMGSHRVRHNWSDLEAAAAEHHLWGFAKPLITRYCSWPFCLLISLPHETVLWKVDSFLNDLYHLSLFLKQSRHSSSYISFPVHSLHKHFLPRLLLGKCEI